MNAAQLTILASELTVDPLTRGYTNLSDQEVGDDLNTVYRKRDRTVMTASEVLNAIDIADYTALTEASKDRLWQLLGIGDINPFGIEATLMISLFGGNSATIAALAMARKDDISRGEELGLGTVEEGDVWDVRSGS